jgi:hypothetical protein
MYGVDALSKFSFRHITTNFNDGLLSNTGYTVRIKNVCVNVELDSCAQTIKISAFKPTGTIRASVPSANDVVYVKTVHCAKNPSDCLFATLLSNKSAFPVIA